MHTVRYPALLLLALSTAACEPVLFSAEIEASEVCISGLEVYFPPSGELATTARPLSAEDLGAAIADQLDFEIDVLEIGLRSDEKDLSTIEHIGINLTPTDPAAALPNQPVDITVYIESSEILFGFQVVDPTATAAWAGTMDLCVHTRGAFTQPL
jgi:hypothetical protein